MTNLSVFEFSSNRVRVVEINGEPWFAVRDILAAIESATKVTTVRSLIEDGLGKGYESVVPLPTSQGVQQTVFISQVGLAYFLGKSRKPKAKDLAASLCLPTVIAHSKQSATISVIQNAFAHLSPVEEFFVSGFRIDLYFPSHRLAVECDENYHRNETQKKDDITRQDSITKILGCSWIRYCPQEPGFCVGKIINRIMLTLEP